MCILYYTVSDKYIKEGRYICKRKICMYKGGYSMFEGRYLCIKEATCIYVVYV